MHELFLRFRCFGVNIYPNHTLNELFLKIVYYQQLQCFSPSKFALDDITHNITYTVVQFNDNSQTVGGLTVDCQGTFTPKTIEGWHSLIIQNHSCTTHNVQKVGRLTVQMHSPHKISLTIIQNPGGMLSKWSDSKKVDFVWRCILHMITDKFDINVSKPQYVRN